MAGPERDKGHTGVQKWRGLSLSRQILSSESLVNDQEDPLLLKGGRFRLRRDLVEDGNPETAKAAFREYYIRKGQDRTSELRQKNTNNTEHSL